MVVFARGTVTELGPAAGGHARVDKIKFGFFPLVSPNFLRFCF